jgi:hypothetical protein
MPVAVVQVRKVRVPVAQRLVAMNVRVRLGPLIALMRVLMMTVVDVAVLMFHRLVHVFVLVPFAQSEPCPGRGERVAL